MRPKSLRILFFISLAMLLPPDSAVADTAAAAPAVVRVKLSMGSPSSVSLYIDGNYSVTGGVALDRQLYTLKLEPGKITLYCADAPIYSGKSVRLVQHTPTSGRNNFIWLKNAVYGYAGYLGDMEFTVSSGCIAVINHVYLEDYLYGVVPHEMNNSWPIEALKAQAVAARNYALAKMGGSGLYDLVDTSADQVYKGYNAANANAVRAVNETANSVLTYGGKLVQIFYSASNGGYTEIPQHVWTATAPLMPYHVIRPDVYDTANPYSLQEVLLFPKVISGAAKIAYQYSSGGVMAAGTGDESANIEKYLKDAVLPAVKAKGYDAVRSADIKIVGINSITPRAYMGQHGTSDYSGVNPCLCFRYADFSLTVLVKQQPVTVPCTIDMTVLADEDGDYQAFDYSCSALRLFTAEQTDSDWRIYHRRYGHGVGLSQRGAEQRAASPDPAVNTYDKILAFYYPSTDISAQSYVRPALTPMGLQDTTNATVVCPNATLGVRSSPSAASAGNILGALPHGARVRITQLNAASGWHKIRYGSRDAYVASANVCADNTAVNPTDTPAPSATPVPTATPGPSPSATAAPYQAGDVNGDGVISISDYTVIRLAMLGLRPLTGQELAAADVNQDGTVSITDYTLIRLAILGLRSAS